MKRLLASGTLLLGLIHPLAAITILLDYTHDASTDNFFGQRPAAKAAVDQAAADLGAVLGVTLGTISPSGTPNVNLISGTFGTATATADWRLTYTNPSTGATVDLLSPTLPSNTVVIYVGMREIAGTALAQGGSGGAGVSLGGSVGNPADFPQAVTNMESASNAYMGRGAGPTIGTLTGDLGGTPFALEFGSALGNLWFDIDTNNNSATDSLAEMDAYWHYDHTTGVTAGKVDFYSVALHEMLHSLGLGASDTWESYVSGTSWTGPNVLALEGSGAGLVNTAGDHIAAGTTSPRLSDSVLQEAVMTPSILVGTRKSLTQLDRAFLLDTWKVAVPEPSAAGLAALGLLGLALRRRRHP